MKKILEGPSRRVGSIFQEVDTNFIEVCNSILRIAFPECTLKGYAETEPAEPVLFDCYLVKEDSTVWETIVEKNQVIYWDGLEWIILPFKITEINEALQFLYFDAEKIAILPIEGLDATTVQSALEQITAALVLAGISIPYSGSGSGSSSI
ncbi:MAG: hypothetical protein LC658_09185 [Bacteroidales bacterium]|nr:hypothetical protein [Bacteroidales bacterium]